MHAVILAAGEGNRMRPLTYTRPKVMLPVANRPILEHLICEIQAAGIEEIILVVGYHDEQIREYFGDGGARGLKITYSTQREQLGTADAPRSVEKLVSGNFLMMNGDILINRDDIDKMINCTSVTMGLVAVSDPEGLGMVETSGENVIRIHEKTDRPPSDLANTGVYLFTPEIFEAIANTVPSARGEYEITDSIQWLIDRGSQVSFQKLDSWMDTSYPWDLLTANESILSDISAESLGEIEDFAVVKGAVRIGKGTVVRSGSYIIGPVVIGDNCTIGPNCFIRPATAIGNNCHIGSAVEIKNSIIMSNTNVPHHNYVGDSVLGEGCNLGSGTKIANLRLDNKNISITGRPTGRRKLGAILGDNVKTGINASINVGTMIGNDAFIGPGAVAGGIISPESKLL